MSPKPQNRISAYFLIGKNKIGKGLVYLAALLVITSFFSGYLVGEARAEKFLAIASAEIDDSPDISPDLSPDVSPTPTLSPSVSPTPSPTPTPDAQEIYYYPEWCAAQLSRAGDECIDENTDLVRAIAITIYNESGALTPQLAADMLKLIDNYGYNAYTNEWAEVISYEGLGWYSLPVEKRLVLTAHLLSRPYTRTLLLKELCSDRWGCQQWTEDRQYPGWNGWGVPFAAGVLEGCDIGVDCTFPHGTRQWLGILDMVARWVEDPTQIYFVPIDSEHKYYPHAELDDRRIMYSYSSTNNPIGELEDRAMVKSRYVASEDKTYYIYFMTFPYSE